METITPGVIAVVLAYCGWRVGVFCHQFGGGVADVGALLCRGTYDLRFPLIVGAIAYAFIRRFWIQPRKWDYLGPTLAVLAAFLVWYENEASAKY